MERNSLENTKRENKPSPNSEQSKLPSIDRSKLKGENGKYLTQSIILEPFPTYGKALYTLKDEDVIEGDRTYWSLPKIYRALEDPTEYLIAVTYFWDLEHFRRFRALPHVSRVFDRLKEEIEAKLAYEGLMKIRRMAESEKGFQAAKYLTDRGYKLDKEKGNVGRPVKPEKPPREDDDEIKADILRLRRG